MKSIKRFRPNTQSEDVFANGCLIKLKILGIWGASTKLDDEYISSRLPSGKVRANYDILEDKSRIDRLNFLREEAKSFVEHCSKPFPEENFCFIDKDTIPYVDEGLEQRKIEFFSVLDLFLDEEYDNEKANFASKYPEHYHVGKYPSKERLRNGIIFEWCYRIFTPPGEDTGVLTAKMYKREHEKFEKDVETMHTMALTEVKEKLFDKIKTLKDQCLGGTPHASTLKSVNSFLERFETYWNGSVGVDGIKELIDECKEYLDGTDADMLRSDDEFRSMVGNAMKDITSSFDEIADERLERSLDF